MAGPAQDAALASTSPAPEVLCVSHVPSTPTPRLEVQFVYVSLATQVKMAATAHRASLGNTRKRQAVRHAAPVPFTQTRLLLVPIKATVNVILVTRVKTTTRTTSPSRTQFYTHIHTTHIHVRTRRALLHTCSHRQRKNCSHTYTSTTQTHTRTYLLTPHIHTQV